MADDSKEAVDKSNARKPPAGQTVGRGTYSDRSVRPDRRTGPGADPRDTRKGRVLTK